MYQGLQGWPRESIYAQEILGVCLEKGGMVVEGGPDPEGRDHSSVPGDTLEEIVAWKGERVMT